MFKVGDLVQLKSGGPRMTVDQIYADGTYGCAWFVGADVKQASFSGNALKLYQKPNLAQDAPTVDDPQGWMV